MAVAAEMFLQPYHELTHTDRPEFIDAVEDVVEEGLIRSLIDGLSIEKIYSETGLKQKQQALRKGHKVPRALLGNDGYRQQTFYGEDGNLKPEREQVADAFRGAARQIKHDFAQRQELAPDFIDNLHKVQTLLNDRYVMNQIIKIALNESLSRPEKDTECQRVLNEAIKSFKPKTQTAGSQAPVSATDTSALQQQLGNLKAQADALSARGQDVATLAARVDNMIAQVNSGNVDPASIDAIEEQLAVIEEQLNAQVSKQSSAGMLDEALKGLDEKYAEPIRGILTTGDNLQILRAFCAQNNTDIASFVQAIGMLNDRGIAILESIIHGLKEAQINGGNPIDYQARFLGITQVQAQTINDNLSGLSRQVDTLNQSGQLNDEQRKQLTDRIVAGIHKLEKTSSAGEVVRNDLQKALKDIVGLPTGLANKLVINPIFEIMSQVVSPRRPQLETAVTETEFTTDSAEAAVNIVNAAMIEPGYLPVTRGQALVFESYTVTDALAQTLASIMNKMPRDVRESITVAVYGENSADALDIFTRNNVTATGQIKESNTATVVYSKARLTVPAEHTRFIQVEQLQDIADNMVTAAQVMLAIFNMPFKQFAASMKLSGIDIGVSDSDMKALFANADMIDGIIRIKPVDKDTIKALIELVGQAA